MLAEHAEKIICPYCGEPNTLVLDCSSLSPGAGAQEFIEDCRVCCRPMSVCLSLDLQGELSFSVAHEND